MDVERDLADHASVGAHHTSTPDLMGELRARTEEARRASEATAEVPLALLQRVAATLGEARAALARSRAGQDGAEPMSDASAGLETARMVALNMALNGAPAAETELYLRRNFALRDPAQVAAEAYRRMRESLSG